jgi:hypothetical protein
MKLAFWLTTIAVFLQIFSPTFGSETDPTGGILGPGSPLSASLEKLLSAGLPGRVEQLVAVKNMPPLYAEPKMSNEGVWIKDDLSGGHDAVPLIYRTFYRPSDNFPNSIVYMMLLNMKRISPRLYLGAAEQYRKVSVSCIEPMYQRHLLAVTNALWQTRHAGKGGIILDGQVLKKMEPGVAAIVVYKDDSMDVLEWNDQIPLTQVRDARQLMHLIVKDGKVVTSVVKKGALVSAEIGLGALLNEDQPVITVPGGYWGEQSYQQLNTTSGDLWFLANRSAFGIRPDGNLVFAVGHHISTVDLAKALVLAGCVRGMHGDANPGNAVGALYYTDSTGKIVNKQGLSPLQDRSTPDRYLTGSYPKDFFAFFRRRANLN